MINITNGKVVEGSAILCHGLSDIKINERVILGLPDELCISAYRSVVNLCFDITDKQSRKLSDILTFIPLKCEIEAEIKIEKMNTGSGFGIVVLSFDEYKLSVILLTGIPSQDNMRYLLLEILETLTRKEVKEVIVPVSASIPFTREGLFIYPDSNALLSVDPVISLLSSSLFLLAVDHKILLYSGKKEVYGCDESVLHFGGPLCSQSDLKITSTIEHALRDCLCLPIRDGPPSNVCVSLRKYKEARHGFLPSSRFESHYI